jgi:ATP-dependent Lon protease
VLAIGGVREKVIAAKRLGIHQIIVPEANQGDVEELPEHVKEGVTFHFASQFRDVAKLLFPVQ